MLLLPLADILFMSDKTLTGSLAAFWSLNINDALILVNSRAEGLNETEIRERRNKYGINTIKSTSRQTALILFLNQFKSPITIILLLASILSYTLQDKTNAIIIIVIVFISSSLGFWQEKAAGNAITRLLAMVRISTNVIRDKIAREIPVEDVVPGDIILLNAGDMVPADSLLIEANELFIDEAAFTGETFPVEKKSSVLPADTVLAKSTNALFMGSHVVSGTGKVLVMQTGIATEFGRISQTLKTATPETAFEKGIRHFGYLLMEITLVLVVLIFGINVLMHKPVLDSFLFTLAIAIGLTPQLLPAIITVNLAQGARKMAGKNVIVKRLNSIENFGSMDVLCSDKTGTLTEGKVTVYKGTDCYGKENNKILQLAKMNATLQQGFKNPIDEAIASLNLADYKEVKRLDEIPYDFIRKRLTLLVSGDEHAQIITKGAVNKVMEVCTKAENAEGKPIPIAEVAEQIHHTYESFSADGYRTLGVAYKIWNNIGPVHKEDEKDMVFAGFISLFDPAKPGVADTIKTLNSLGIKLKIITGDNVLIAKSMAAKVGLDNAVILSGNEMKNMSIEALRVKVIATDIFAEVEPLQKQMIILSLKKAGKVVGYMGDGINDAAALHAADVGISVNTAVDVAKEAADLVLLNQDLNVLIEGVREGRRTFANTQKYIFMATSANFGNMFSMAGASLFLRFLPLLPQQILLTNLMTDLPAMTIATDTVDEDWISKPRRWDIKFIKRFMLVFGILSSVFDYLTFGALLFLLKAGETEFQTGWFIESVVSASLIVLAVRTHKAFIKSKPGKYLLGSTVLIALIAILFPFLPFAHALGFTSLPIKFYIAMLAIVFMYLISAELMKKWFYKLFHNQ